MGLDRSLDSLDKLGYFIHDIDDTVELLESRTFIANFFRSNFGINGDDEFVLNNSHLFIHELDDTLANQIVLDLITQFKTKYSMHDIVYSASKKVIDSIFGLDIACQKNPNIVFQYPESLRFAELHTDSPNNSPFELVYWLPLVNCYESKSLYIINYDDSKELNAKLLNNKYDDWQSFKDEALQKANHLEIRFGQILGFWSGLLHGSLINSTDESRFSYNVRFKNLYAPHGKKDPLVFYAPFKTSPITHLALHK